MLVGFGTGTAVTCLSQAVHTVAAVWSSCLVCLVSGSDGVGPTSGDPLAKLDSCSVKCYCDCSRAGQHRATSTTTPASGRKREQDLEPVDEITVPSVCLCLACHSCQFLRTTTRVSRLLQSTSYKVQTAATQCVTWTITHPRDASVPDS